MRLLAACALFVLTLSCQHYHYYSIDQRESVSIGMSEQQVLEVMGEPGKIEEASATRRLLIYKGQADSGMFNNPRNPYEFMVTIENGQVVDVRTEIPDVGTRR